MTITNPKLSDRIRPDVEAAPWVIAEIEKLELQLEQTRLKNAIVYGTSHPEIYKTKEDEACEERDEARQQLDAANTLINKYREETTSLRQQLAEANRKIKYDQLCASELEQQLAFKQAEVDALMLEYCPSEMSQEQLDNWAEHQRPSGWKTNDELRKQLAELLDWQQKAFAAHPNIDIDIDRLKGGN